MLVDYARNCTAGTTPRGGKAGELIHQPWLGAASERANFDYATFVGDLVWVTKTRFELKFAAHTLAMHMRNPGPHQVNAANHVLRYLFGTRELAITNGTDRLHHQSARNHAPQRQDSGASQCRGDNPALRAAAPTQRELRMLLTRGSLHFDDKGGGTAKAASSLHSAT